MLGIVITPPSITYQQFITLACEAEAASFSHVFIPEGTNDSLMCAYAVAGATERIRIGTYTSNIYFREPALCAASAEMVQNASRGRFILGLGVGHAQSQRALGIEMINPRQKLRDYVIALRRFLSGEAFPDFPVSFRKPDPPLPIYFAATTLQTARLAGELADGLELYLCTPSRVIELAKAADEVAVAKGRGTDAITVTVGLPTFVSDDLERARQDARSSLMYHLALPTYNGLLARSGFESEAARLADAAERHDSNALAAAISDRLLDATALVGPPARCVEILQAYREAVGPRILPLIFPFPFAGDYSTAFRKALKAFGEAA